MHIEIKYEDGYKTSLDIEGNLPKGKLIEKVVRFFNAELSSYHALESSYTDEELTIRERLEFFLKYDENAPKEWFTTSEIKKKYEEVYGAGIKLSTISTYLARMYRDGVLERKGNRFRREYRVITAQSQEDYEKTKSM